MISLQKLLLVFIFFLCWLYRPIDSYSVGNTNNSLLSGSVQGYVFNYYGLAISGATVGHEYGSQTVTGPDGSYSLSSVPAGEQTIYCAKTGYNFSSAVVVVPEGGTANQNFSLTQPNMVINPLIIDQNLNPDEIFSTSISVLNNGNGPLTWNAEIQYLNQPASSCQYSIRLFDSFGDGWNSCALDVYADGELVLNNITLSNGFGPAEYFFSTPTGSEITTVFIPGFYVNEPSYKIFNSFAEEVWYSPASSVGPANILPGQLSVYCGPDAWLSLGANNGSVNPFGGIANIPVILSSENTTTGQVYQAEISFGSNPNVGAIVVPVTMNVVGAPLGYPANLTAELTNDETGQVNLSWEWAADAFQFFLIRRNGAIVGTTTATEFADLLPAQSTYCYTVQAVHSEGTSIPTDPACVDWLSPDIIIEPVELEGWVWENNLVQVQTEVQNAGDGNLYFTFPEWSARKLLARPGVRLNRADAPEGLVAVSASKGDESYNGAGYPVVLGAGGPDPYGYVWIDNDEDGGPVFDWIDIQTTGTLVTGLADDNITGPFPIGFDFPYYGQAKSQFWINSNGAIGFSPAYLTSGNTPIPTNSTAYKDFIAWFWDDLDPGNTQTKVFYQVLPNKLIIQFVNYFRFPDGGPRLDAEIILYKNGKILLLYDNLSTGLITNSCSIGLQSPDPATGLQVVFNSGYLKNGLAIALSVPSQFISDVDPPFGNLAGGGARQISVTYTSADFEPGVYGEDLILESNDPDSHEALITNTMHVYQPGVFSGLVTNLENNQPLPGVTIIAGNFQTETNPQGAYFLKADEGVYDLEFSKPGYLPVTVADTSTIAGGVTPVSVGMWKANYPPAFLNAEVVNNDSLCRLSWALPLGPFEVSYDDGEADDYFVYQVSGSWHAVKFTPWGYPSNVFGGKVFVGNGQFPGPFLGTEFGIAVFDDDGPNGLPGTMLDSSGVTVNNYGWVTFDWLEATIESGSFYLAVYQSAGSPACAPVGIDLDLPTYYRSYSKFQGNNWSLSPLQDFMIRVWVTGVPEDGHAGYQEPQRKLFPPKVPAAWKTHAMTASGVLPVMLSGDECLLPRIGPVSGMSNREIVDYHIVRYSGFDPEGSPSQGEVTNLMNTTSLQYDDSVWAELSPGWYAYGVSALYTSGLYSSYTLSNIVGRLNYSGVNIHVALSNGQVPDNIRIDLNGLDYPHETFNSITGPTGNVSFVDVWQGTYDLKVYKPGYDPWVVTNLEIFGDTTLNVILAEKKYAPECLYVDPLTLDASWCSPKRRALLEGFEGEVFPPSGWQVHSEGAGWFRTLNGSGLNWAIPLWDSHYACVSDDVAGTTNAGHLDYLITPPLDLRESAGYLLTFDSYYDGAFGELAFVEFSTDNGDNWNQVLQLEPASRWVQVALELEGISGPDAPETIWIAFHADDQGEWASGWAVDNVKIEVPAPPAGYLDYYVYVDNVLAGITDDTTFNLAPLNFGVQYLASVAASYSSGMSAHDQYLFTSRYLYPPTNLQGEAPDRTVFLSWYPPLIPPERDTCCLPENLLGYNVYRDGLLLLYQEHENLTGGLDLQSASDEDLEPGIYSYAVAAVYDITPYGFPGETAESAPAGPIQVTVDYCFDLEFFENWSLGNFLANNWTVDSPNWQVSGQSGNPAPEARFHFSPLQTDYTTALESYPICATGLTEGRIWLDFDLKLETFSSSGAEFLHVEVWNWTSQTWVTLMTYSNASGSYGWEREHIDLTGMAMGQVFKFRFRAEGANSINIVNWSFDNIHVYRACSAPTNLELTLVSPTTIRLNWEIGMVSDSGLNPGEQDGMRELKGFNVYMSRDFGEYTLIGSLITGNFIVIEDLEPANYCFIVIAVWESPTDICFSDPSEPECIFLTASGEQTPGTGGIEVSPNPANHFVRITSDEELERVEVFHITGVKIMELSPEGQSCQLSTTGWSPGIFMIIVSSKSRKSSFIQSVIH